MRRIGIPPKAVPNNTVITEEPNRPDPLIAMLLTGKREQKCYFGIFQEMDPSVSE
ncbi:hypothetical protein ACWDRB_55195 [Nonomuraea sp. NPDC003707]